MIIRHEYVEHARDTTRYSQNVTYLTIRLALAHTYLYTCMNTSSRIKEKARRWWYATLTTNIRNREEGYDYFFVCTFTLPSFSYILSTGSFLWQVYIGTLSPIYIQVRQCVWGDYVNSKPEGFIEFRAPHSVPSTVKTLYATRGLDLYSHLKECRELDNITANLKDCLVFEDAGVKPVQSTGSRWVIHKLNAMKQGVQIYKPPSYSVRGQNC